MRFIQDCDDLNAYLATDAVVDFDNSREVAQLAYRLYAGSENEARYIENAYVFVRDKIAHSADIQGRSVTCKASEVLRAGEGICFAKSHLLAALLRCCGIPAGFCYQRLILDDDSMPQLILHGLNAVYLPQYGWIRLDARGNKSGVNARFSLWTEQLAFPVRPQLGEEDFPFVFSAPDPNVVSALTTNQTLPALWANLPTRLCNE